METGVVKFYIVPKGYGFIINDETGEEHFVHATGIRGGEAIKQNDRVEYELVEGKRGIAANNVARLK